VSSRIALAYNPHPNETKRLMAYSRNKSPTNTIDKPLPHVPLTYPPNARTVPPELLLNIWQIAANDGEVSTLLKACTLSRQTSLAVIPLIHQAAIIVARRKLDQARLEETRHNRIYEALQERQQRAGRSKALKCFKEIFRIRSRLDKEVQAARIERGKHWWRVFNSERRLQTCLYRQEKYQNKVVADKEKMYGISKGKATSMVRSHRRRDVLSNPDGFVIRWQDAHGCWVEFGSIPVFS
jgi:hypothetical protein